MKKKLLTLLLVVVSVITCFSLTACNKKEPNKIKIVVPDGAPALSVTTIVKDGLGIKDVNLTLDIVNAESITNEIVGKKYDVAIVPSNAAYKIYLDSVKAGDKDPYKMVATATYGNLFVVGKSQLTDIKDLQGKLVYSIGENKVPHKVFEKVAKLNNLELNVITNKKDVNKDKINVIFRGDGAGVLGELKTDNAAFGLLAEPAVTGAKNQGNSVALDLQLEYQKATGSSEIGYPQAVVVARQSFIENNKETVKTVLKKMVANMDYVNNSENQKGITDILKNNAYGNPSATTFPPVSIKGSNVLVKSSKTAKEDVTTFLKTLMGVGEVKDGFFYELDY